MTPPYAGNNLTAKVRLVKTKKYKLPMFTVYVRGPVYFYSVGSSIGSSPHPCHWHRMIAMYGDRFGE